MSRPLAFIQSLSRRGFIAGTALAQLVRPSSGAAAEPAPTGTKRTGALFIDLAGSEVAPETQQVTTSGYGAPGVGAATYVEDDALDAAHAAAHPRTAFRARDGRVFRLARDHVTPFMLGAAGDGSTDDYEPLQAFADLIVNDAVAAAEASGRFGTSRTILWGKAAGEPATTLCRGALDIRALAAMQEVLRFRNMGRTGWIGEISVTGTGGASYLSRTCAVGIVFENCGRMHFSGGVRASRFHFAGVSAHAGNDTLLDLGNCGFADIGSGHRVKGSECSLRGTWSNPSNSGAPGSAAQRTTIRVDTLFPAQIEQYGRVGDAPIQLRINNYLYFVYAVDRASGTATIYPWLDKAAGSSGTLEWVLGGGLYLHGADSNVIAFGEADCIRCGRGLAAASLYAPTADRLVTQSTGTALLFGREPGGAVLGGYIRGLYCENNQEDICALSRQGNGFHNRVGSAYGLNFGKCWATGDARDADGRIVGGEFTHLPIPQQGGIVEFEKRNRLRPDSSSLTFRASDSHTLVFRRDGWAIDIAPLDRDLHRLMGYSGGRLLFESPTDENGAPTGAFVFNAPHGGSVNGEVSVRFSGFAGPALFSVEIADALNERWTARLIAGHGGANGVALIVDQHATLSSASKPTHIFSGELTEDRILTLPSAGRDGRRFRIVRHARGAHSLLVNNSAGTTLKTLLCGQWCEVEDDGGDFHLIASGNL